MQSVSYYKLHKHRREADGTLLIPVSSWGIDGHTSNLLRVPPNNPAHSFWLWVTRPWRWLGFRSQVDDTRLEELRLKHARRAA